jgi:hypothetical protein
MVATHPDYRYDSRLCPSCGFWLPVGAFVATDISVARTPLCIPCRQERRDAYKLANRWVVKARTTRRDHGKKLGIPVPILEHHYGWVLDRMARDLEHAYGGDCPGCGQPFAQMPNGLQDLTVDVMNRNGAPVWGVNTRALCQTDNRRKGTASIEKQALIELAYRIRRGDPAVARLFTLDPLPPAQRRPTGTRLPDPPIDQLWLDLDGAS